MKRIFMVAVALVLTVPAAPTEGITIWGCAPSGERRNVLYLADRGSQSYIKFSGQRISATLASDESEKRWSFGANHISLNSDNVADYFEGGELKARFRCQQME
jgi:hypothetical protein